MPQVQANAAPTPFVVGTRSPAEDQFLANLTPVGCTYQKIYTWTDAMGTNLVAFSCRYTPQGGFEKKVGMIVNDPGPANMTATLSTWTTNMTGLVNAQAVG